MIEYKCEDCVYFDDRHKSVKLVEKKLGKVHVGFCRRSTPGSLRIGQTYYGVHPVMDAHEYCGGFKKRS